MTGWTPPAPAWTWARLAAWLVPLAALLAALVGWGSGYDVIIAVNLAITLLLTLGLNLVIGNLGLLSFAHGAFFGIGAYASAIAAKDWGLSPWACLPLAMLAAACLAGILGFPVLRLRGIFLAVASLAFASFFQIFVRQATDITQGAYGISAIPPLTLFGTVLRERALLLLAGGMLAVLVILLVNLAAAPLGRAFIAVRDNEAAAAASGIPIARTRLIGFVLSALIAGAAGWLHAFANLVVNPYVVDLELTFLWFFMVLIGGPGSIAGVVAGAILLGVGPELLGIAAAGKILVSGVLMLLVVLFAPRGLGGLIATLRARITAR